MLIQSIQLNNFLSFGASSAVIPLGPLNVIIGPNGSGRKTLKAFFRQGFKENQLPAAANPVERIEKTQVYDALARATRDCKTKSQYGKGEHSFKLLAMIDPEKVVNASPWARRFVEALQARMGNA